MGDYLGIICQSLHICRQKYLWIGPKMQKFATRATNTVKIEHYIVYYVSFQNLHTTFES